MNAATVYLAQPRFVKWLLFGFGALNLLKAAFDVIQGTVDVPFLLTLATGVLFLAMGFTQRGTIGSHYYARADEVGIRIARPYRRTISLPWNVIASVSLVDSTILICERSDRQHKVRIWVSSSSIDARAEFRDVVSIHID